ncbi:MAG: hypothetical protein ACFFBP_13190 [Promethearchaeota archaeon]
MNLKKKQFGIILLNHLHRVNLFLIEQLRNLKMAVDYCQENNGIRILILTNKDNSYL